MNTTVTLHQTTSLYVETCVVCGILYGFDAQYEAARRRDGRKWQCPNGHTLSFKQSELALARTELDDTRASLAATRARLADERAAREREHRQHAATKGQLTKTLKRVHAGVCPHCNRTFQQLARHMASQHLSTEG